MPTHEVLYLSRADVEKVALPMRRILAAVEEGFAAKGRGQVEMPPKPGVHPRPDSFVHAMPAYVRGATYAGVKWVAGYPANQARGLPYITGLLILNDAETGFPLSVMDCTWITAMRTGAASAVAAKYLARPDSHTLGILGCGVQGHSHVLALREIFRLTRIVAYDLTPQQARQFALEITKLTGLPVEVVEQPRSAVEGLDLVVTAGPILKKPHATIQAGWLSPGAFASAVDFDSYWSAAALAQFQRICTDDHEQYRHYREIGFFQTTPPPQADLGELVAGVKVGRQSPEERTMAMNLGLALEDMVVAPLVYEEARKRGIGTRLPL